MDLSSLWVAPMLLTVVALAVVAAVALIRVWPHSSKLSASQRREIATRRCRCCSGAPGAA